MGGRLRRPADARVQSYRSGQGCPEGQPGGCGEVEVEAGSACPSGRREGSRTGEGGAGLCRSASCDRPASAAARSQPVGALRPARRAPVWAEPRCRWRRWSPWASRLPARPSRWRLPRPSIRARSAARPGRRAPSPPVRRGSWNRRRSQPRASGLRQARDGEPSPPASWPPRPALGPRAWRSPVRRSRVPPPPPAPAGAEASAARLGRLSAGPGRLEPRRCSRNAT